jgi:hypothetical protein
MTPDSLSDAAHNSHRFALQVAADRSLGAAAPRADNGRSTDAPALEDRARQVSAGAFSGACLRHGMLAVFCSLTRFRGRAAHTLAATEIDVHGAFSRALADQRNRTIQCRFAA